MFEQPFTPSGTAFTGTRAYLNLVSHLFKWCLFAFTTLGLAVPCGAQEIQPRRWSHLPIGINFVGAAYSYTEADISDSPALRLEDVEMDMDTWGAQYIRTFELFGKSARVDIAQAYQTGYWEGLLDGSPASTERSGWTDTIARFAVNFYGAPPLAGKAFGSYQANLEEETIAGIALAVHLPTGQYKEERLINLGTNRFTIRPQAGVVHRKGKWSAEVTGSVWFFTDNDEFFEGNKLETDPLYVGQGHIWYTFRPGLWVGAGAGFGYGAQSTINGVAEDDRREVLGFVASFSYPLSRDWGVKIAYAGRRRQVSTGNDSDTIAVGFAYAW